MFIRTVSPCIWHNYYKGLDLWARKLDVRLPIVPGDLKQAYHMFYLILPDASMRDRLLAYLNINGIRAVFHYIPLHGSLMGLESAAFYSECPVSEALSNRIVRLPFFLDLDLDQQNSIIKKIILFEK